MLFHLRLTKFTVNKSYSFCGYFKILVKLMDIYIYILTAGCCSVTLYLGAEKSLARPGRKQARKHVRDARDFNNIETRAVIKFFFFLKGKAPKEIHAILTETLACFIPGRAKDLSAPL